MSLKRNADRLSSTNSHRNRLANSSGVFVAQLVDVEQVAAARLGVAMLTMFRQTRSGPTLPAASASRLTSISTRSAFFPPVAPLARPVGIGGMRHAGWRREVGFAPLLVRRHARGDLVQLLERVDPEELVEVEIAVRPCAVRKLVPRKCSSAAASSAGRKSEVISIGSPASATPTSLAKLTM
jgi:hypothetical protein